MAPRARRREIRRRRLTTFTHEPLHVLLGEPDVLAPRQLAARHRDRASTRTAPCSPSSRSATSLAVSSLPVVSMLLQARPNPFSGTQPWHPRHHPAPRPDPHLTRIRAPSGRPRLSHSLSRHRWMPLRSDRPCPRPPVGSTTRTHHRHEVHGGGAWSSPGGDARSQAGPAERRGYPFSRRRGRRRDRPGPAGVPPRRFKQLPASVDGASHAARQTPHLIRLRVAIHGPPMARAVSIYCVCRRFAREA
jgi:hypothetical protein